ncbi:MAG: hypothetical protein K2K06_02345, partial [Oscillospiraceae bacterium]|nr:hypothetical protein [Oscillospiraceae bacterium]
YYGCYSENFLKDNEEYVSFFSILKLYYGSEDKLNKRLDGLSGKVLYDDVVSVIEEVTLLKFDEYLNIMLGIDSIILNEDRHFNNIGVIKSDGYWRYCPIFDNGLSLLSDLNDYPFYDNILFCMRNVKSMPFSTDSIKQFKYTSHRPIIIDFRSFKNDLVNKYVEFKSDEFERAKSVLLKRCSILEGKVWVQKQ